ncbi:MAG: ion channel [Candidatus Helarchaeota archaeon]
MSSITASSIIYRIKKAYNESFLLKTITLTIIVGFFSTIVFYIIERPTQLAQGNTFGLTEALWWTIITMTTVGFGDVVPLTQLGKFFGMFVAVYGAGVMALTTVYILTYVINKNKETRDSKVIVEIDATKSMIGKKFKDLFYELKEKENLILVGVKRYEKKFFNPSFEFIIEKDDFLIVAREQTLSNETTIFDL